jgi:hypothetical protein
MKPACTSVLRLAAAGLAVLLFAACATTPDTRARRQADLFASYPEEVQANLLAGQVDLGYTMDMVEIAFGAPTQRSVRRTELGEQQVWTYGRSRPGVGLSIGVGGFGGSGRTSVGGGVSVGTGSGWRRNTDWSQRVVFTEGRVVAVETADR